VPLTRPVRKACRLLIYLAAAKTTTIRVPTQTRDRLKELAARRGESTSEVVVKLVNAADEETMLAEAMAGFERLADDPETLAAYRAESRELETGFEAPAPEW
jgi:predicted DNA-binding protein